MLQEDFFIKGSTNCSKNFPKKIFISNRITGIGKWYIIDDSEERAEWQKSFVKKVVENIGLTHTDAMELLGLVCEERQKVYMQGYNEGFEKCTKRGE